MTGGFHWCRGRLTVILYGRYHDYMEEQNFLIGCALPVQFRVDIGVKVRGGKGVEMGTIVWPALLVYESRNPLKSSLHLLQSVVLHQWVRERIGMDVVAAGAVCRMIVVSIST